MIHSTIQLAGCTANTALPAAHHQEAEAHAQRPGRHGRARRHPKGSPIQDEYFAQAREMWHGWRRYLAGEGERLFPLAADVRAAWERHFKLVLSPVEGEDGPEEPAGPNTAWVETLEDLKARDHDLGACNPNQDDRVVLADIQTSILRFRTAVQVKQMKGNVQRLAVSQLRGDMMVLPAADQSMISTTSDLSRGRDM